MAEVGRAPGRYGQPMTRISRLVVVAVTVLALSGCSTAKKAAAAMPTPTTSPSTATLLQYASVLNGPIGSLKETWREYLDARCDHDSTGLSCQVMPTTMDFEAKTIVTAIDGAEEAASHVYVGPPPAEIAALVATTYAKAQQLDKDLSGAKPAQRWEHDMVVLIFDVDQLGPYLRA